MNIDIPLQQQYQMIMEGEFSAIDEKKSTIFVGLACLDIVKVMNFFPVEDIGQRCEDCLWQRGGNAANSATVFSYLQGLSDFFGTLSSTQHSKFMTDELQKCNVRFEKCITVENSSCPTSVVILNQSSGTRTVLHTNKNLRELNLCDFVDKIDLTQNNIGWIHFEGRDNACEIGKMLSHINDFNQQYLNDNEECPKQIVTSLEAEKLRFAAYMDKYDLWKLPNVLFVSKDFARLQGYTDMISAVRAYSEKVKKGAIVVCAWGDEGAAAMSSKAGVVVSPAFPPEEVIDTCGAGDTFNAAVIRALFQGRSLQDAVTLGCRVAGAKCGFYGFDGLEKIKF